MAFGAGLGIYIVPKHIFSKVDDWSKFTFYDPEKGWPISTTQWKVAHTSPQQKLIDRKESWWAADRGLSRLSKVERLVYIAYTTETQAAQLYISNQLDSSLDVRPATMEQILAQNPKVTTWTGSEKPYGYTDQWPTNLMLNNTKPPFDDKDVRWALNYAMNRKQIIDVGFKGSGDYTVLPFPAYTGMKVYFDAVKDLLEKNPIDVYDPNKTAQIMQSKGYAKNGDGFWAKDGQVLSITMNNAPGFFLNFAPVIVAQFRQAGFDASFKNPTNAGTLQNEANVTAWIGGHQGGVRDPYLTLNQFHSRYNLPIGQAVGGDNGQNRWTNTQFDAIVDEMSKVAPGGSKYMDLYHQAMAIWIPELPTIPTVQWYQICPNNTAYWKGWPNEENPYTTPAAWHRGAAGLFIGALEPA
jgi:peptide/nickel transport system substrate-binding protein